MSIAGVRLDADCPAPDDRAAPDGTRLHRYRFAQVVPALPEGGTDAARCVLGCSGPGFLDT
jgi:hypothetical protein